MLHALRFIWCLPLTAYGLPLWGVMWLLSRFSKEKRHWAHMECASAAIVFVAHGPLIEALLKRHPMGAMQAATLGACIFACDAQALARTWDHECVHVQQAMRWGIVFPLAYLAAGAWARLRGGCAYADNVFEREAMNAETCAPS
jgi:hypothetical protein